MNLTKKIAVSLILILFIMGIVIYNYPQSVLTIGKNYLRWQASVDKYELKAGEYNWSYLEGGNMDGETIIFVHGFGADKDRWGRFLIGFSKKYHIISPDLPAFGETTYIKGRGYGVASQVRRLNEFIEKKGINKFHLLGISMGGGIAGAYAAKYPRKILSLALLDTFGIKTKIKSDFRKNASITNPILVYNNIKEFDIFMKYIFYKSLSIPQFVKKYLINKQKIRSQIYSGVMVNLRDGGENYLGSRLDKIEAPTLIVWGKNDRIFSYTATEILKKKIRNSKVIIYEKCGHVPYIEKYSELTKDYLKFLSSLK